METEENLAEIVGEIPKEEAQEEDYDPAWNDDDDDQEQANQEEEIENPDENDELNDENAEDDEESNVQNDAEEDNDAVETQGKQTLTQKNDIIIEEMLENAKVQLTDGTEAPIFSRGPRYSRRMWPVNCHLCGIDAIGSLKQLKNHLVKGRHERLLKEMPIDAATYKAGLNQTFSARRNNFNNPIKIYPGERITEITPEYYDRILPIEEKVFQPRPSDKAFQALTKTEPLHVYNQKNPVVGLSYCFYVDTFKKVAHYCSLCQAFLPGSAGFNHFIGSAHCMKYATRHFQRLLRKLTDFLSDMKDEKAKQKIIHEVILKVYRSIEEKRGLRKVNITQTRRYVILSLRFSSKILHYADNHVMETDEQLKEMIEKCRKGESLLDPDAASLPNAKEDQGHPKTHAKGDTDTSKHSGTKKEESSQKTGSKKEESSQKSGSKREDSHQKPKKGESSERRRGPHLEDNANNWDRYRRMVGAALDDIDERYAGYERKPEKHSAYEDEWKKFWNRRVKEIEKDGLNPDDYDFKSEWIPYWKDILQKYRSASISKAKFRTKKSLRLPFDKRSPSPIRRPRSQRRKGSPSPDRPSRRRRTRSRSPAYRGGRRRESSPDIAKPTEPPGVISVLRILTALEDNLGSLGPKALEYLSKSLLYEKEKNQNANQLMFNQDLYVFFVTAKEKLKGQLIANLVEKPKYKAVANVIEEIETLIDMFDDYCKRTGQSVIPQQQNDPSQASIKQEPHNDQYGGGRSQNDYNRNRQQDYDRKRDSQYGGQYQRGNGEMNQQNRNSGAYDNQYRGAQNQASIAASSAKYNNYGSNLAQHGNMSSYSMQGSSSTPGSNQDQAANPNQGYNSNQYSRGSNQGGGGGGVWHSGTNVTFRNNASNPQGVAPISGSGGNVIQGNPQNQAASNLSTMPGDRGGSYNATPTNYSSSTNLGYGNNSSLGYSGSLNTLAGDAGNNYKRASLNTQNASNQLNQGYTAVYSSANNGSFNQGRNMAPPQPLMNKPLGNYGSYSSSTTNTRGGGYGGGNL